MRDQKKKMRVAIIYLYYALNNNNFFKKCLRDFFQKALIELFLNKTSSAKRKKKPGRKRNSYNIIRKHFEPMVNKIIQQKNAKFVLIKQ